jgi:transposase
VLQQESLQVAPDSAAAVAERVGILIPLLQAFDTQYRRVYKTLKALASEETSNTECPEQRTMALIRSLPGVGVIVSTTLLGEAASMLAQSDEMALRSYDGVAPITKQSGKSKRVSMRYGCNQRVREACYHWARTSVQRDSNSRSHYLRLRNAGHGHARALRGVCDRLISVLMAVLRTGIPYNAEIRSRSTLNSFAQPSSA